MDDPVLVTGVAGFIGFHTALRLLREGIPVVGIDNINDYYDPRLKQDRLAQLQPFAHFVFQKLDIADRDGMEKLWAAQGPFRRVIHMAAQAGVRYSLQNPYAYAHSNSLGHLTVLEMCRHTADFEHLVYASSSSVYGANTKLPFSVTDPVDHPVSLYAATKRGAELMSESYARLYDIPQTGLRLFTVYGPWGRPDMALFLFVSAIDKGEKVPVFNNGDMRRDFTYIDDVVDGIAALLKIPPAREGLAPPHRILNIGNTRSENLKDFLAIIEGALNRKADMELREMQAGDVRDTYADIAETTALTGFRPQTNITEGIPRFIQWYRDYYGR